MSEYIQIILGFITGGGISTILTLKYVRQTNKLEFTEKAIKFIEGQYDHVLIVNKNLLARVEVLEKFIPYACFDVTCKGRQSDADVTKVAMNIPDIVSLRKAVQDYHNQTLQKHENPSDRKKS